MTLIEAKKFGAGSAHIIIPRKFIGKMINVELPTSNEDYLNKKQTVQLVEQKIYEARQQYG